MCRLYAFRANEETRVECSLVHAQNALLLQRRADSLGRAHPHGWGLAIYHDSHLPHVRRAAACEDIHFNETVERIYTNTVNAHVRYTTVGQPSLANSHPFSYRQWAFDHNGTVIGFGELQSQMALLPKFRNFKAGTTDIERSFYWLLSRQEAAGIDLRQEDQDAKSLHSVVAVVQRRKNTGSITDFLHHTRRERQASKLSRDSLRRNSFFRISLRGATSGRLMTPHTNTS